MSKFFAVGTHASDNPTKAALPFMTAIGALEAGKDVVIGLLGEAAYLAKPEIAKNVLPVGFPPIAELIEKTKGRAAFYV